MKPPKVFHGVCTLEAHTVPLKRPSLHSSIIIHYSAGVQVSVTMSEAGSGGESGAIAEVTPGAGGQMWSGGGEDRPEQLIPPEVQEEVSLLEEQTHE